MCGNQYSASSLHPSCQWKRSWMWQGKSMVWWTSAWVPHQCIPPWPSMDKLYLWVGGCATGESSRSEELGDADRSLDEIFKSNLIIIDWHLLMNISIQTSQIHCEQSCFVPSAGSQCVKSEGIITHRGFTLTYMEKFIMHSYNEKAVGLNTCLKRLVKAVN